VVYVNVFFGRFVERLNSGTNSFKGGECNARLIINKENWSVDRLWPEVGEKLTFSSVAQMDDRRP